MSNNIFYFFLFTFDCWSVCMYVCAWCSCVGVYFFPKPWEEKAFCFWKTSCKYCWWKINICCTLSFHLSLEMMTKTTIFMDNSGDVNDTEADYTCPSWTRAFDVCCIFVGGVVWSGQEKQREGVIPNTSRIRRSNTATYPLPSPTPPGNCAICGANRSLCFSCHKALLRLCCKHQNQQRPAFQASCTPPRGATLSWFAWHRISPCLLTGLGIYCNAIVLGRIGPVLTPMMPSSLNLQTLFSLLEAMHGDGHVWGQSVFLVEGHKPSIWPLKDNFHAGESASYSGVRLMVKHKWLTWTCHIIGPSCAFPFLSFFLFFF